jgi:hypothetical protein
MARKRLTFLLLLTASAVLAQQNGRFATLKSQAFDYFDRGQYDKVAGKLEEIWEQDHSDLKVGEYLAMGYLYGEKDLAKAQPIMKEVLAKGGQATFLVQHSHEKLGLLNGDTLNNYCSGKMSIVPGKVSFVADDGMHSTTFSGAALKTLRLQGSGPGRLEIKSEGKNYTFRVKSETHAEAAFLLELVQQNLR